MNEVEPCLLSKLFFYCLRTAYVALYGAVQ